MEEAAARPVHIGIAVVVVIIASHNHLHSKQPISPSFSPSYLFRTYGYKGPPPLLSLPPFPPCPPVAAFLFPAACAYQAGALSAPQQYSKPDTSNWRWFSPPLSLPPSLWGHSP